MSTPSLVCLLALAVSLAGCGVGKLIDDGVDLVKIVASDPVIDGKIIEVAAVLAAGVIVQIADGDAFRDGPRGDRYRARMLDSGETVLERLAAGEDLPRALVEDAGMLAYAVRDDRVYWWSGARVFSVSVDGDDVPREEPAESLPTS